MSYHRNWINSLNNLWQGCNQCLLKDDHFLLIHRRNYDYYYAIEKRTFQRPPRWYDRKSAFLIRLANLAMLTFFPIVFIEFLCPFWLFSTFLWRATFFMAYLLFKNRPTKNSMPTKVKRKKKWRICRMPVTLRTRYKYLRRLSFN